MKYFKNTCRRAVSIFLTVLMLITCWVFVAPQKASAASITDAGSKALNYYKVDYEVKVKNGADFNSGTVPADKNYFEIWGYPSYGSSATEPTRLSIPGKGDHYSFDGYIRTEMSGGTWYTKDSGSYNFGKSMPSGGWMRVHKGTSRAGNGQVGVDISLTSYAVLKNGTEVKLGGVSMTLENGAGETAGFSGEYDESLNKISDMQPNPPELDDIVIDNDASIKITGSSQSYSFVTSVKDDKRVTMPIVAPPNNQTVNDTYAGTCSTEVVKNSYNPSVSVSVTNSNVLEGVKHTISFNNKHLSGIGEGEIQVKVTYTSGTNSGRTATETFTLEIQDYTKIILHPNGGQMIDGETILNTNATKEHKTYTGSLTNSQFQARRVGYDLIGFYKGTAKAVNYAQTKPLSNKDTAQNGILYENPLTKNDINETDTTYRAAWWARSCPVTFVDWDGAPLGSATGKYELTQTTMEEYTATQGLTPYRLPAKPKRVSDEDYEYEFLGWLLDAADNYNGDGARQDHYATYEDEQLPNVQMVLKDEYYDLTHVNLDQQQNYTQEQFSLLSAYYPDNYALIGDTQFRAYYSATPHTWVLQADSTQYTSCTQDGFEIYKCSNPGCNMTKTVSTGSATGHSWPTLGEITDNPDLPDDALNNWKWTINSAGTAYTKATLKLKCKNCDYTRTLSITPTPEILQAASCTANGETLYTATRAFGGNTYTSTRTLYPAAFGHKFTIQEPSEQTQYRAATCQYKAQYYKTCATCGVMSDSLSDLYEDGDVLDHYFNDDPSAAGYEVKNTDSIGHNYKCTAGACGKYGVMRNGKPLEGSVDRHDYGEGPISVVSPADCENAAVGRYRCAACGREKTESFGNPKHHNWQVQSYGWNGDGEVIALAVCQNDIRHEKKETVQTALTQTEPTCETAGSRVYTATFETKDDNNQPLFATQVRHYTGDEAEAAAHPADQNPAYVYSYDPLLKPIGHSWGDPTYTWAVDNSTVTAQRKCLNDPDHVDAETVETTSDGVKPDCSNPGRVTYTAEFTKPYFITQTKTTEESALGHKWGPTEYVDSGTAEAGNLRVTATRPCENDPDHNISETAEYVYSVSTEPNCTEDGVGVWTATFNNPIFETQTINVPIPKLGHDFDYDPDKIVYQWNSDYTALTATVRCKNNDRHTEVTDASVSAQHSLIETCTEDGEMTYTGVFKKTDEETGNKVPDTRFTTQVKKVPVVALGHLYDYDNIEYVWLDANGLEQEPYVKCKATLVCQRVADDPDDDEHPIRDEVDVTCKVTDATCDGPGTRVYTADFPVRYFRPQTKEFEIPAYEHEYVLHEASLPDCITKGNIEYYSCQHCSRLFKLVDDEYVVISADEVFQNEDPNNHSVKTNPKTGLPYAIITVAEDESNCQKPGNKAYKYCEACGLITELEGVDVSDQGYTVSENKDVYQVGAVDSDRHVDLQEVEAVAVSCEGEGNIKHWYCSGCKKYFLKDAETDALIETPKSEIFTQALGHQWSEDPDDVTYTWSLDNKQVTASVPCTRFEGDPHPLTETVNTRSSITSQPTCEDAGERTFVATFQDAHFVQQSKVVEEAAKGHNWNYKRATYEWADDFTACTAKFYCKTDSAHKDQITTTSISQRIEPSTTCDEQGKIVYTANFPIAGLASTATVYTPAMEHDFDYQGLQFEVKYDWSPDHTRCTAKVFCQNNQNHSQTFNGTITSEDVTPSSCTQTGTVKYTATFPNGIAPTTTEPIEKPATGHRMNKYPAETPNCLHTGNIEYYQCERCGKYFRDARAVDELTAEQVFLPKSNHMMTAHAAKAPTCTEVGNNIYYSCAICQCYFSDAEGLHQLLEDEVFLPKREHVFVEMPAEEPTCTSAGHTAYHHCKLCKQDPDFESIPALGHGDYEFNSAKSGYSADGTLRWDTYMCNHGCGDYYMKLNVIILDKNNNPLKGAKVTVTSKYPVKTMISGTTNEYGEVNSSAHFTKGTYKISVTYETISRTIEREKEIKLLDNATVSGSIGKLSVTGDSGSGSSGSSGQNLNFFQRIIQWFRNLFSGLFRR